MALVRALPRCVPRAGARLYASAPSGTGWPKPSSRDPVQPYERHAVDEKLKKAQLPENVRRRARLDPCTRPHSGSHWPRPPALAPPALH